MMPKIANPKEKLISTFWKKVEKTDTCWNWTGHVTHGCPALSVGKNPKHRVNPRELSLELAGREIVPGKQTKLTCENALCVNPDHLVCGDEARFWAKVQKLSEKNGGCWVWTGYLKKDLYGDFSITVEGKKFKLRAHQYSWYLHCGRMPPKCMVVCHKCDHPYCVNPDHLFIGTHQDNAQDKVDKGRQARGETHAHAKLTDEIVREARRRYDSGESIASIARAYGVSAASMSLTVRRKTWRHIT